MNIELLTDFEKRLLTFQSTISQEWHRRLDPILSTSQAKILWKLKTEGKKKITELAEEMYITPGAVTSLSVKLISNGYAVRSKDEKDRRVVYLEITPDGEHLLCQYSRELKKTANEFFKDLTEEELNMLVRIFDKMMKNIEKVD